MSCNDTDRLRPRCGGRGCCWWRRRRRRRPCIDHTAAAARSGLRCSSGIRAAAAAAGLRGSPSLCGPTAYLLSARGCGALGKRGSAEKPLDLADVGAAHLGDLRNGHAIPFPGADSLRRLRSDHSAGFRASRRRRRSIQNSRRARRLVRRLFGYRRFRCEQRLGRSAHLRLRPALALVRGSGEGVLTAMFGSAVHKICVMRLG